MKTILAARAFSAVSTTATRYTKLVGTGTALTANLYGYSIFSAAGTIDEWVFDISYTPLSGETVTLNIVKNASTEFSVVFSEGETSKTSSTSVSVSAGDYVYVQVVNSTTGTGDLYMSSVFTSTSAGEGVIIGGTGSITSNTSTVRYGPPMGWASWTNVLINNQQCIPTSGTISDLYIEINTALSSGNYQATLLVDGTQSSLACTVDNSGLSFSDTNGAHAISVSAGTLISLEVQPNSPNATKRFQWGLKWTPDTDGEAIMLGGTGNSTSATTKEYNYINNSIGSWSTTEANFQIKVPECTISNLSAWLSAAPGTAPNEFTFLVRDDNADTDATVTISGPSSNSGTNSTDSASIAAGSLINLSSFPFDVPTTSTTAFGCVIKYPAAAFTTYDTTGSYSASIFSQLDSTGSYSGSVLTVLDSTGSYSSSILATLDSTGSYSASVLGPPAPVDSTASYSASIFGTFDSTGSYSASLAQLFDSTASYSGSIAEIFDSTGSYSTSIFGTFDSTGSYSAYLTADSSTFYVTDASDFAPTVLLMEAGDTLIIADGTYIDGVNGLANIPSGTSDKYTTVRAETDFGVKIYGNWTPNGIIELDYKEYVVVQGIIVEGSGTGGSGSGITIQHSHHCKILRCGAGEVLGAGNSIGFTDSSYCLVEDCFAWGKGRYHFGLPSDGDSVNNIFRRCVSRFDGVAVNQPNASFSAYDQTNTIFQNCIAIDCLNGPHTNIEWFFRGFFTPNGFLGVTWKGCIALNIDGYGFMTEGSGSYHTDIVAENNISWHTYMLDAEICGSVLLLDNGTAFLDHFTSGDNTGTVNGFACSEIDGGVSAVQNSIITGHYTSNLRPALYRFDSTNNDYNVLYDNYDNYSDIYCQGAHDHCSENGNEINPFTNSLLYLPRIEAGSDLEGLDSTGGNPGATVLKRYGVSGTLYGETGWDTLTDDNLWPWPYEDVIHQEVSLYDSTARGFAVEGETLTKYIWEYLGNEIPSDIYGTLSTVDSTGSYSASLFATSDSTGSYSAGVLLESDSTGSYSASILQTFDGTGSYSADILAIYDSTGSYSASIFVTSDSTGSYSGSVLQTMDSTGSYSASLLLISDSTGSYSAAIIGPHDSTGSYSASILVVVDSTGSYSAYVSTSNEYDSTGSYSAALLKESDSTGSYSASLFTQTDSTFSVSANLLLISDSTGSWSSAVLYQGDSTGSYSASVFRQIDSTGSWSAFVYIPGSQMDSTASWSAAVTATSDSTGSYSAYITTGSPICILYYDRLSVVVEQVDVLKPLLLQKVIVINVTQD